MDYLGRGAFCQHVAVADDVGVVTNTERFTHVVVGDQDADVAALEEVDDALDLDHRNRVDACKRLVEQDKARLRSESARNFDPAAFAA